MRLRGSSEVTASIADLNGNVLAARVAVDLKKNNQGSFYLGPADSFNFEMDRPHIYRLTLEDGRYGDIETMGFHLLDNSGTNFVSFRLIGGLNYPPVLSFAQ